MRRWNSYVASLCSGISLFGAQPAEKVMDELNRSITVRKYERGENIVHSTSFCGRSDQSELKKSSKDLISWHLWEFLSVFSEICPNSDPFQSMSIYWRHLNYLLSSSHCYLHRRGRFLRPWSRLESSKELQTWESEKCKTENMATVIIILMRNAASNNSISGESTKKRKAYWVYQDI